MMQPIILSKHPMLKTPVNSPPKRTTRIMMGRTRRKKNLLILLTHLKSRKQGRLKKLVHWVLHISSEKLAIKSNIL